MDDREPDDRGVPIPPEAWDRMLEAARLKPLNRRLAPHDPVGALAGDLLEILVEKETFAYRDTGAELLALARACREAAEVAHGRPRNDPETPWARNSVHQHPSMPRDRRIMDGFIDLGVKGEPLPTADEIYGILSPSYDKKSRPLDLISPPTPSAEGVASVLSPGERAYVEETIQGLSPTGAKEAE